jgi:hypothetical protein
VGANTDRHELCLLYSTCHEWRGNIIGAFPKGRICLSHPHHKYGGGDEPRESATVYFIRKDEVRSYKEWTTISMESTWATRVAIHHDRRYLHGIPRWGCGESRHWSLVVLVAKGQGTSKVHIRQFGDFERRQPRPSTTTGNHGRKDPAQNISCIHIL